MTFQLTLVNYCCEQGGMREERKDEREDSTKRGEKWGAGGEVHYAHSKDVRRECGGSERATSMLWRAMKGKHLADTTGCTKQMMS